MKTKIVLIAVLSVLIMPKNVFGVQNGFVQDGGKTYYYENGVKVKGFKTIDNKTYFFSRIGDNAMRTGTFAIDGAYYHFNKDGTMVTGKYSENGKTYFFNSSGKRVGGFQTIDGNTYFFSRVGENVMRTGTFAIDGAYYRFGTNGIMYKGWLTENGNKYYYDIATGKRAVGFKQIDGNTYFFGRTNNNPMRTGKFAIDGAYYYFKNDGSMFTGILTEKGKSYFYSSNGKKAWGFQKYNGNTYFFSRVGEHIMRTGMFAIDGSYYYFKDNGVMYTGWLTKNNKKYYYDLTTGKRAVGFKKIDGNTYFFGRTDDNPMRTGKFTIDGYEYYFKSDGVMHVGYLEENGKTYYYSSDGKLQKGIVTIDGKKYFFNSKGEKAWGFQKYNGNTYFFGRLEDHSMRTGYFQIDGEYYYFLDNGIMQTGIKTVNGKKYFFSRVDGHQRTGWLLIDNYMYYFDPDTKEMTVGTRTIDGVEYVFTNEGRVRDGFVKDGSGNMRYYYPNGTYANDWVIIEGKKYFFNSLGVMIGANVQKAIDVSKYNKEINWQEAKTQGQVDAAIIRAAFRGYGSAGNVVEDEYFYSNAENAKKAGIKLGAYFYSQAITTQEAVAEADKIISMVNKAGGKNTFSMPIVFDTEYSTCEGRCGRADHLTKKQRTDITIAFLERVKSKGYTPMIYASKNFLYENLDMSRLLGYKLWVAQYNHYCTYDGTYQMWQYSSTERVAGVNGNVDMNVLWN